MELVTVNNTATKADTETEAGFSNICGGLQINLPIIKSPESLRIEIAFKNLNLAWLSQIIKQYEHQLWTRIQIDGRMKFKCLFCNKLLCYASTLRNHLFHHLEIYPFKCFACDKKYTSNHTLGRHTKSKHYKLALTADAERWLN